MARWRAGGSSVRLVGCLALLLVEGRIALAGGGGFVLQIASPAVGGWAALSGDGLAVPRTTLPVADAVSRPRPMLPLVVRLALPPGDGGRARFLGVA